MGTPFYGNAAKMAMDKSTVTGISDFDSGSQALEFISESVKKVSNIIGPEGIRGTRSREATGCVIASSDVRGSIELYPRPDELDFLLPLILGTDESTDVFALAETLQEFGICIERGAKRFIYTGCRVDRAVFSCSQGQLLKLVIEIEGETEVVSATAFPATVPALTVLQPYTFKQAALVLQADASAVEMFDFTLTIDNMLDKERRLNSETRTQIQPTDRMVTLQLRVPYTADEVDLHDYAIGGGTGSIALTNGNRSITFAFANLKAPADSPVISGRATETTLQLNYQAYKLSTTNELIVTNDSTG